VQLCVDGFVRERDGEATIGVPVDTLVVDGDLGGPNVESYDENALSANGALETRQSSGRPRRTIHTPKPANRGL
jgi:hypothetical protein